MKIRWTEPALQHLQQAYGYIQLDNPMAAGRVIYRIEGAAERLRLFPQLGRHSKRPRSRELAIPGTPFVLVYRVDDDALVILAVFHGARNWHMEI